MAEREVGDPAPTFYVDGREYHGISGARMTAAEILAYAGHDADEVRLAAEGHSGRVIPDEEAVPVQDGSRFVTLPRE